MCHLVAFLASTHKMPVDPPLMVTLKKCLQVLSNVLWKANLPPSETHQHRTALCPEHLRKVMLNKKFISTLISHTQELDIVSSFVSEETEVPKDKRFT